MDEPDPADQPGTSLVAGGKVSGWKRRIVVTVVVVAALGLVGFFAVRWHARTQVLVEVDGYETVMIPLRYAPTNYGDVILVQMAGGVTAEDHICLWDLQRPSAGIVPIGDYRIAWDIEAGLPFPVYGGGYPRTWDTYDDGSAMFSSPGLSGWAFAVRRAATEIVLDRCAEFGISEVRFLQ